MSNYCGNCRRELFGLNGSDFEGILSREDWDRGYSVTVLCEGCMWTEVDPDGECTGVCGHPDHGSTTLGFALPHEASGIFIRFSEGDLVTVNNDHELWPGARGVVTISEVGDDLEEDCAALGFAYIRRTPDGPIVTFHVTFENPIIVDHGVKTEFRSDWVDENYLSDTIALE